MGAVVADGRLRDPVLIVADDRHLAVLEEDAVLQARSGADCPAQAIVTLIRYHRCSSILSRARRLYRLCRSS